MKTFLLLTLLSATLLTSCRKYDGNNSNVVSGPKVHLHEGMAWTWVELNGEAQPVKIAVSIDDAALNSVTMPMNNSSSGHDHDDNVVLLFDARAKNSIFKHVWLNWNPNGHEPELIYGKPHFDVHFYLNEPSEREVFVDPVKLEKEPSPEYIPYNHLSGPGCRPWVSTIFT